MEGRPSGALFDADLGRRRRRLQMRRPRLRRHSYAIVTTRIMAIAAGHEDADDLDDPDLMLACNRELGARDVVEELKTRVKLVE